MRQVGITHRTARITSQGVLGDSRVVTGKSALHLLGGGGHGEGPPPADHSRSEKQQGFKGEGGKNNVSRQAVERVALEWQSRPRLSQTNATSLRPVPRATM
jgi:hypothetical protein